MSASILYHCFGLVKVDYLKTEFRHSTVTFWVRLRERRCARCGSSNVIQKGKLNRVFKTVPIGSKLVFINLEIRRFYCCDCRVSARESINHIALPKKHYTKRLTSFVCTLYQHMTVNDIAHYLHLHWNTVWEMLRGHLEKSIPTARELRKLRRIGIDEIAIRKGHKYLTLVVDQDTGRVVYVAPGRKSQSIVGFLKRLRKLKAPVEVVTTDMWIPYISVIMDILPKAKIVFDKFHIIALLNRKLDELRRREYWINSKTDRDISKGTRFLLLKHSVNLSEPAREKLNRLLRVNKSLALCYEMKEMLYHLWECKTKQEARSFLEQWCKMASSSAVQPLMKFANKMLAFKTAVLNYFDYPITNAMVEGINNKIKMLKRQAFGYRNLNNFYLKIYSIHQSRYALIG